MNSSHLYTEPGLSAYVAILVFVVSIMVLAVFWIGDWLISSKRKIRLRKNFFSD